MNKRLIYAEDAINAVAKGLKGVFVEYQDVAEKLLDNVPSAQPYTAEEIQKMQDLESAEIEKAYQLGYEEGKKDAQPKWTPVTENLPDDAGVYLVTDNNGEVVRYVFNMNESSKEFWYRNVVAWMSQPEPYAERGQDGTT